MYVVTPRLFDYSFKIKHHVPSGEYLTFVREIFGLEKGPVLNGTSLSNISMVFLTNITGGLQASEAGSQSKGLCGKREKHAINTESCIKLHPTDYIPAPEAWGPPENSDSLAITLKLVPFGPVLKKKWPFLNIHLGQITNPPDP